MNLRKPSAGTVGDKNMLLTSLLSMYDAIIELAAVRLPSTVPNLKSVTLSTYADLRKFRGDVMGELGPRLTMIGGGTNVLDGGEGVFAWDPSSVLADDGVNVFQVASITTGRWRRLNFAAAGLAPANAQYIVGAADATLTAERLVTDTATVAWDLTTPGQAKASVPGLPAIEAEAEDAAAAASAAAAAADEAETDVNDLERRFRLLLRRYFELFDDVPPGLEAELPIALAQ